MKPLNLQEVLERIVRQDSRYHKDAYFFLREALEYTQKQLIALEKSEARHITGQELLAGIQKYALSQYGPMAKMVLNEWGIQACEDFGELVFNMVDQGLLSKTESDSRAHFQSGFDFDEAFSKPFRPQARDPKPASAETKAGPS